MARKHAEPTDGVLDHHVDDDSNDPRGNASSRQQRYRELSHLVEERRPQLVQPSNTELVALVHRANQLTREDQTPTERLQDARLFRSLTRCGDVKGRRLSFGNVPQTPLEIVDAIREKYKIDQPRISLEGEEDDLPSDPPVIKLDWTRIADDLAGLTNQPPGMTCMKGWTSCIEKKHRVQRMPQRREPPSEVVQEPERHAAEELDTSVADTERNVHRIWSILREEKHQDGVLLTRLTLDHDSYPQTVLNVFDTMFLIKDLRMSLTKRRDGTYTVAAMKQQDARSSSIQRRQACIRMTYKLWEEWCRQVSREDCLLTKKEEEDSHAHARDNAQQGEAEMEEARLGSPVPLSVKSERSRRSSRSSKRRKSRRRLS